MGKSMNRSGVVRRLRVMTADRTPTMLVSMNCMDALLTAAAFQLGWLRQSGWFLGPGGLS
jgi:hypothetical protein